MDTIKHSTTIYIYGCRVIHDLDKNVYRYFVGDKAGTIIETTTRSDMAYRINMMQALM